MQAELDSPTEQNPSKLFSPNVSTHRHLKKSSLPNFTKGMDAFSEIPGRPLVCRLRWWIERRDDEERIRMNGFGPGRLKWVALILALGFLGLPFIRPSLPNKPVTAEPQVPADVNQIGENLLLRLALQCAQQRMPVVSISVLNGLQLLIPFLGIRHL